MTVRPGRPCRCCARRTGTSSTPSSATAGSHPSRRGTGPLDFFAYVLERDGIARADPARDRFRAFLFTGRKGIVTPFSCVRWPNLCSRNKERRHESIADGFRVAAPAGRPNRAAQTTAAPVRRPRPRRRWRISSRRPPTRPARQYPQVNSERRARFRIVAPQAQSVRVPEWGGITLTKGEDGAWVGTTRPLDEGFHYYRINIDGADVPDPGSKFFYGASRWGSAIEIPAKDAGLLRRSRTSRTANCARPCTSPRAPTPRAVASSTRRPITTRTPHERYPVLYLQHGAARTRPAGAARGREPDHGQPDRRG